MRLQLFGFCALLLCLAGWLILPAADASARAAPVTPVRTMAIITAARSPAAGFTPRPTPGWVVGTPTPTPSAMPAPATPSLTATLPTTGTAEPTATITETATVTATATTTATLPPAPTSTPTPDPGHDHVSVRSHRSFRVGNTLTVVGEVTNHGTASVFDVTIRAAFYSAEGRIVAVLEGQTLLPATMAQQNNPFRLVFAGAPATIAGYDLSLTWNEISVVGSARMTVMSEEVRNDNGVEVFGELCNDQPFALGNVRVVASFYDAEGNVLDVFTGSVAAPVLAPGEIADYRVPTSRTYLVFDSCLVQTQGERVLHSDVTQFADIASWLR